MATCAAQPASPILGSVITGEFKQAATLNLCDPDWLRQAYRVNGDWRENFFRSGQNNGRKSLAAFVPA